MVKHHPKVKTFLSDEDKRAVTDAINSAEARVGVEFRVAVAHSRQRDLFKLARNVYGKLQIGKAKNRPGVLLLILPARRVFILFGSEETSKALTNVGWERARDGIVSSFREGRHAYGIRVALSSLAEDLSMHFPPRPDLPEELPDQPVEM